MAKIVAGRRACSGDGEDVGGYGSVRAADQRVDVQRLQDVSEVAGERRQARDGGGDRVEVGGRLTAGARQDPGESEAGEDHAGPGWGDRGKRHRSFGQNFYEKTTGPDDQEGAQGGVARQA